MITGKVFLLFLKAIFCGLFNTGSRRWNIAGRELISKRTFRMPDSSYKDRLIGLRILKRVWLDLGTKGIRHTGKYKIAVFDSRQASIPLRVDYLLWVKKYDRKDLLILSRDAAYSLASKFSCRMCVLLLGLIIIPATLFSSNRVQWALILPEFAEVAGIINALIETECKRLHYFSPAEKDANLTYLILHDFKVTVTKHPSPGALVAHNSSLITDVLAFSSPYQEEEYKLKLHESIIAERTERWPPETAHRYEHLYTGVNFKNKFEYELGFYSHGGWDRIKAGRTQGLFSKPSEEERCLQLIADYLKKHKEKKVVVFLHPKEKRDLNSTKGYYFKFFTPEQVFFFTDNIPSSHAFNMAHIGVGSYSTILFERDYCGFKTLILAEPDRGFPLPGTGFFGNAFNTLEELEKLIASKEEIVNV